jgi:hypothetical protein
VIIRLLHLINQFWVLLQYPASDGTIYDYRAFVEQAHASGALVTVAADPLSLTLLTPPGNLALILLWVAPRGLGFPWVMVVLMLPTLLRGKNTNGRFQGVLLVYQGRSRHTSAASGPSNP